MPGKFELKVDEVTLISDKTVFQQQKALQKINKDTL